MRIMALDWKSAFTIFFIIEDAVFWEKNYSSNDALVFEAGQLNIFVIDMLISLSTDCI